MNYQGYRPYRLEGVELNARVFVGEKDEGFVRMQMANSGSRSSWAGVGVENDRRKYD